MNFTIFSIVLGLSLFSCGPASDGSLGTFKGSMTDLAPKTVGTYQLGRGQELPKDDKSLSEFQAIGGTMDKYVSGNNELIFSAYNFESPEKAKTGFDKWKEKISTMHLKTQEEGPKKKGANVVGDRILAKGDSDFSASEVVVWTNGSVLFAVSASKKDNANDPLEFEKKFTY